MGDDKYRRKIMSAILNLEMLLIHSRRHVKEVV